MTTGGLRAGRQKETEIYTGLGEGLRSGSL